MQGIGTYSQAGAQLGFGVGWTMLVTYPLMAAIQEISGRIGRVTGHGIAGNVCRNYPAPVIWSLIVLLFVANTINVAADLGAMGDALKLLIGGPGPLYVLIFGTVSVLAQIFFNNPPQGRPLGQPEDESRPDVFGKNREESKAGPQLTVIAFGGFFEALYVGV